MCRFWRGTVAAGRMGLGMYVHTLHVVPSTFIYMLFFNIIVNTMDPYSYRSFGSMEDLNCRSNRKYCQGLNECCMNYIKLILLGPYIQLRCRKKVILSTPFPPLPVARARRKQLSPSLPRAPPHKQEPATAAPTVATRHSPAPRRSGAARATVSDAARFAARVAAAAAATQFSPPVPPRAHCPSPQPQPAGMLRRSPPPPPPPPRGRQISDDVNTPLPSIVPSGRTGPAIISAGATPETRHTGSTGGTVTRQNG